MTNDAAVSHSNHALRHGTAGPRPFGEGWPTEPREFWEHAYVNADNGRQWSGRANLVLTQVAAGLAPGTALDLGCGEGADVIWLALRGWRASGVDISPTAVARAQRAAASAGAATARFIAGDIAEAISSARVGALAVGRHADAAGTGTGTGTDAAVADSDVAFDLVSASFFHAPPTVELPRTLLLRRAAELVTPGGLLLITSHAAPAPWADGVPEGYRFLTPQEELAELALDEREWTIEACELRQREVNDPDGGPAPLDDGVVLARRRD
ncbi:class I SAM-dependent methyltransferase [Pseudoclavibacter endophyticus]|uniref:Methyltransferase domain-containing protein n=1 Tax=Pseudoclavibacter endophyticus TaxID=1778590 RepID=A0A6H9WHC9_9MICO|nr:class I SAM-dependent methyltransferase [Pseudoclavibacter endophyticus]KAB1650322.1 methyltransferase domain-containing protein [Pseudoclavibacter endophyticus]